jgi:hypothetical protein
VAVAAARHAHTVVVVLMGMLIRGSN